MCDEITEAENADWLVRRPLGRREFGLMSAGAAGLALFPGCASGNAPTGTAAKTASRKVVIETPDGMADAFFVYPVEGRHPAVVMWPDVAGLRQAFEIMATRLAEAGYAVLAVNQYYRSAPAPVLESFAQWRTEAGQAKLAPMRAAITSAAITSDAGAFIDWLNAQPEVDTQRGIGSCGYCMGGPFTFRTAAARPGRAGAICSFHGAGLASDAPDSPHRLIPRFKAAILVAIAQGDDARDPEAKDKLRAAAEAAGRPAEIEVYPAQHGWCVIDSPVYDETQAEKAWGRMLATFKEYL